jgi:hypothetical protein
MSAGWGGTALWFFFAFILDRRRVIKIREERELIYRISAAEIQGSFD